MSRNVHLQPGPAFSSRESTPSATALISQAMSDKWPSRSGSRPSHKSVCRQQGITLVGALFIIIVMALLGTGLLQLMATSQQSVSQELTSTRAYFAAQSALQWGMYQASFASATGSHTLSFNYQGLVNTSAAITLNAENIAGADYYQINSDGRYGSTGDREFSHRKLLLRFRP